MFRLLGKLISNLIGLAVTLAVLIGGCLFVGTAAMKGAADAQKSGSGNPISKAMDAAEKSFAKGVAKDLIEQYDIVKNGTDEMAKSIRAGAVAEMYLQAKDQANYESWKAKSDAHMKRATGQ